MYSFLNLEPIRYPMPSYNSCFMTCIQVSQEAGKVVWYSHLCVCVSSVRLFMIPWTVACQAPLSMEFSM